MRKDISFAYFSVLVNGAPERFFFKNICGLWRGDQCLLFSFSFLFFIFLIADALSWMILKAKNASSLSASSKFKALSLICLGQLHEFCSSILVCLLTPGPSPQILYLWDINLWDWCMVYVSTADVQVSESIEGDTETRVLQIYSY